MSEELRRHVLSASHLCDVLELISRANWVKDELKPKLREEMGKEIKRYFNKQDEIAVAFYDAIDYKYNF